MALSSSTREELPLVSMEAKMIVATGHAHCQQLKDMLSKQDTSSMVVVMASINKTSTAIHPSTPLVMDPGLLAVACSGSWRKLQSFLSVDPSSDEEARLRESFLYGVTVEGDTFLHVIATNSVGDEFMEDGLSLIHIKAVQLLFERNKKGDTALHCAARADKFGTVSFLIDLAPRVLASSGQFWVGNDATRVKALLEMENNSRCTVLHEAVRVGNKEIVEFLMEADQELASSPTDCTSPLYLAILLENKIIAETLYRRSHGILSYSGPNGLNALHAAILRGEDLTKMLLGWNNALTIQQDENGSTPLHMAAPVFGQRDRRTIRLLLLKANPNALYQPDHAGLFPIHVAASVNASNAVADYVKNSPRCAGLRDARGRTFIHIAVDKKQILTVYNACRNRSLSWILNMQDNDGNTALHLAVQLESLIMFCVMFANMQVHLSLTNGKGETPLDIARLNRGRGLLRLNNAQNSEVIIHTALTDANAKSGICRQDYFEEKYILQKRVDEKVEMEKVKDATQNQSIGAALIAAVTFSANFAMPGGYRADDPNGGTPTRAGRYDFDAFVVANALAFTFSATATTALMSSESPSRNTRVRAMHYAAAYYCMKIAIKCLVTAFALGTYTMLAPVAHRTAVAVCAMSSLVLIYQKMELITKHIILIVPFCVRKGMVFTFIRSVNFILSNILLEYWPIIVIFLLSLKNYPADKVEPPVQAPTPSP